MKCVRTAAVREPGEGGARAAIAGARGARCVWDDANGDPDHLGPVAYAVLGELDDEPQTLADLTESVRRRLAMVGRGGGDASAIHKQLVRFEARGLAVRERVSGRDWWREAPERDGGGGGETQDTEEGNR